MMVTQRTRDIYLILLNNLNNFLSIKEIADQLNVTERTVYRQLKEVNEVASFYNVTIVNEVGRGIRLSAKKESIRQLESLFVSKYQSFELSTQDRISAILFYLLHEDDFVKAKYFAETLNVSVQSIRNDLNRIKEEVVSYGMTLTIKQANGYVIEGAEIQKRILLSNIIRENISFIDLMQWIEEEKTFSIYTKLLNDLGYHSIFKKVISIIENIVRENKLDFSDEMFQDCIVLISLMIKRLNTLSDIKHLHKLWERPESSINVFLNLKNNLENVFLITLSKDEEVYLDWIISLNSSLEFKTVEEPIEIDLVKKVHDFIVFVETTMGCRLRNDVHLQTALFEHLDRTLARTRSGITIKNPMLSEIKRSYEKLYSTIKIAANYVFPEDRFPEDEIGFLVLHFAVALDKVLDKSITALVVCSSGMGSSKMLANRLIREIPEIEIKKIVSFMGLNKEDLDQYDIVFSTVTLPINNDEYVMVSPLLNKKELLYVKNILESIRFGKLHRKELLSPRKPVNIENFPQQLEEISLISKYGSELLKNFKVVPLSNVRGEKEILKALDKFLLSENYTMNSNLLIEHSTNSKLDSYFGIPNTNLGYIHCRTHQIKVPLFVIFDLDEKTVFSSMEKELMEVTAVILVMSPAENQSIIADFLSMTTMLIIESPESIEMFEQKNEKQLYTLMSERIKNYLVEKIL